MLGTWLRLVAFASALSAALAADIRGKVQWNEHCAGIHDLGYAKAILDNGKVHYGGVTHDGSFFIPNVPEGTYVLSISSHDHSFEHLRIDVPAADATGALPEARPYIVGTPLSPPSSVQLPYPPTLAARRRNDYFVPPERFNALGMLQSPMVLMMIAVGFMAIAMPYLMKNMDPEALEDLQQQQAKIAGIQSSFNSGDIRSSLSQLMSAGEDAAGVAPPASKSGELKNRGNKAKRR